MVAEFYLVDKSFEFNDQYSIAELEKKIMAMQKDLAMIKQYKANNKFLVHHEILSTNFLQDLSIRDLLNNVPEANTKLDRDVRQALKRIIFESQMTNITTKEALEVLLPIHDRELCHGLFVFHPLPDISPELQVIYGIDGWYKFRRHFLGKYPGDAGYFLSECKRYYPRLFFHERNVDTVSEILADFSQTIVFHLSALNDVLYTYKNRSFINEADKYQHLTRECQLNEDAASRDTGARSELITWPFANSNEVIEEITCYPHFRLSKNDRNDQHYHFNRIYFHEGKPNIAGGRILIGHIGAHR